MRATVSTTGHTDFRARAARYRIVDGMPTVSTVPDVALNGVSESERRARLVYWIRDAMRKRKIKSVAALAKGMGAPSSSVSRWLSEKGTAPFPMVWLGPLCRVLQMDPMLVAILPAVPEDPLAPYLLQDDDPWLVSLDAARLAQLDRAAEAVSDPPAETQHPVRPRRSSRRGER